MPKKYEYKLCFVDRKTLKPLYGPETIQPQFTVDIDELYRTQLIANPRRGIEAAVLTDDVEVEWTPQITAQCFAEFYAADVYYREVGVNDWKFEANGWRPTKW